MRMIGSLDSSQSAKLLGAYLLTEGIKSKIEEEEGEWEVWIKDEDQLETSKRILSEFQTDPSNEKYRTALAQADSIQREEERKRRQYQKNLNVGPQAVQKKSPLTIALIAICALVALLTQFGSNKFITSPTMQALTYTFLNQDDTLKLFVGLGEKPPQLSAEVFEDARVRHASLFRGQVWRLITPIFIHSGVLHIVFNMLWLFQLGRMVEHRYGSFCMGILVLLTAAISNFVQCAVPELLDGSIPAIVNGNLIMLLGGMSGVVFGLLGFVWIKTSIDPESRMFIPQSTVMFMLGYLVFCMTPLADEILPNVANWAHGIGLLVGMVFAFVMTQFGK